MNTKPPVVNNCAKTRKEMAHELNVSISTLYRRLRDLSFDIPNGLIPPDIQIRIYEALGYTYRLAPSTQSESRLTDSDKL